MVFSTENSLSASSTNSGCSPLYASSGLARLEKLHLPFPVAQIFFPGFSFCSRTVTAAPFRAAMIAAIKPLAPAPVITTCLFFIKIQAPYQPFSEETSKRQALHVPR